ncbi:MAG: DNA topoisomerase III [Verrucomicrobia bacterium]|nr:MAG: DNA topoisomerase III [Verrucomicrobiota bacterium]
MSKTLIIAEKPSVAIDLARVLGVKKSGDHYENDRYVISSAVGHVVEMIPPEGAEVKRGKWKLENLPVLPDHFDLVPKEKTKDRLYLLKKLANRPDVTEIINACDAGREGELIFRNTMRWIGGKKPTRRLWLQSMTADSIRAGFEHLRSEQEMRPLADAARSRAESDWLVGINATRALTSFNSRSGGFQMTAAGRVQTPTLAILAGREEKIRGFKPRSYFEVHAEFGVEAGSYRGRWFDENFKKDGDEDARAERIWGRERAAEIEQKCTGKTGVVTEEKKPSTQLSPLLYDLTTLQREANNRFGLHARRTLQLAQALYEKHKVLTYPRTDSRYLPEDNLAQVRKVMSTFNDPTLARHAKKALNNDWVKPTKRVFNNAKVSDHHAIIPTGASPARLDEFERKIYDMVARRTIAVFYPAAQFEVTTRITRVEGEPFKTDGKIIVDPGWLAVYGREAGGEGEEALATVSADESAKVLGVEVRQNETKPPARFTEATLLSAMEGAGKLVEDEELREAMRERGLGTPATRSQIIEGLIHDGYIERKGKELIVTAKGLSLITLLRNLHTDVLCTPEMTGEWESRLKQMAHGKLDRRHFMEGIRDLTREIVENVRNFRGETIEGEYATIDAKCPNCGGGPIKEDYKTFRCLNCDWLMWKTMASRQFEPEEVHELLAKGRVGPLQGFRSKMGRPFEAVVKLGAEKKPLFDFGENGLDAEQKIDTEKHEALGLCPVCHKGRVYVLDRSCACENAIATPKTCNFRISKNILHREIPKEQVQKLITTGKTDLLHKFISKKGRAFSAYLKLENGKVGFEFEEKKARPKKKIAAPRAAPA